MKPIGIPISDAIPTICRLPTMALAIPPPTSPVALGSCVKKFQSRDLPPLYSRNARITNSEETAMVAQMPVAESITQFTVLRQRKRISSSPFGAFSGGRDDEQSRHAVDDDGKAEKHEAEFHQSG